MHVKEKILIRYAFMYIILIFLLTWVALWEHLLFYDVPKLSCFLPSEHKTHNIRAYLS